MKAETDLHQAMDAVAATTPSLDAATILARGKRHRTRRTALLAGCTTATVVLGLGATLSILPLASPPPQQAALPSTAVKPSGPSASSAAPPASSPASPDPTLAPAVRFARGPERRFNGAFVSDITDKSLPSGQSTGLLLRLVRDPRSTTLPTHVDDVTPQRIRVKGVDVRLYLTGSDQDIQQAEWVHERSLHVLQWMPGTGPHRISESDVEWMIASSIGGSF